MTECKDGDEHDVGEAFTGTASEYMAKFNAKHSQKKKRTNWKKELKAVRGTVIDEVISHMRAELRAGMPEPWKRGYYSAITKLEIMKVQNESA